MQLMRAIVSLVALLCLPAYAQPYDIVLHGGRVIDPANNIDGVMDIAITGNRIAAVAANLPARKIIDVSGLIVVPVLAALHAHVFGHECSLSPHHTALPAGTLS